MVTLLSQIVIQNKSGANQASPVSLHSFWASTGSTEESGPRLAYDPYNNRWLFSAVSDPNSANSSVLIAASQTSDPTGSWNIYRVDYDAANTVYGDFASLGFNKDWVVVSANSFDNTTGAYQGAKIFTFRKSELYAGTTPLDFTLFSLSSSTNAFTVVPAVTYDNTLATMYLVQNWSGVNGQLHISTITGAVGSETYTNNTATVTVSSGWADIPTTINFAPQEGTSNKIANFDSRILNVVYRNGSIWAAQNAFLPSSTPTHTAAQWWQLQPNGTVQQFGRVQDTTGATFYAFPSISVNSQGDALLGFSSFSSSQFASAGYAFRAATDTASTMQSPALLKAGEATYFKDFSSGTNYWGFYSNTSVDPADNLSFWTIQEYASTSNNWGTWWGEVTPPAKKRRGQVTSD